MFSPQEIGQMVAARTARRLAIGIIALLVIGFIGGAAFAQESDHPAFGLEHSFVMRVEAIVPVPENATPAQIAAAIKRVEARAVAILRRADSGGLSLEEARAKVRVDGRTDVRRCLEVIFVYQLRSVTQARVTRHQQAASHPEGGQ